ncbi:hypothetical protein KBC86_00460 [Candidatus Gracilibacteria bacterium]|nr:hypothetical protein [Candidatus Gracilibacteria bacterium]
MTESTHIVRLGVTRIVVTVFGYEIVVIDEPLEKKYLFRIIKGTFSIIGLHMTFIEGFV